MARKVDLNQKLDEIIEAAKSAGLEQHFLFLTTLERYQVQLRIMADLNGHITAGEPMVTKEYVKGRRNLYVNPAIVEYNRTSTAANQTVQTLMRVIVSLQGKTLEIGGEDDEL